MSKTISRVLLLVCLAVTSVGGPSASVMAQQKKIPEEPLFVVDASTGKSIPEVLFLPRYSRFKGVSTMLGEGPGGSSYSDYLAEPFVYRPGERFKLKLPKSIGFGLAGLLFMGKGRSLDGVLLIAPGYRPMWFSNLWSPGSARHLKLTPIPDNEWSLMLDNKLNFEKDVTRIENDCSFWDVPSPCSLEIHYNKKERALVRAFLRQLGQEK